MPIGENIIYPLTIITDRYGGTYSGGDFTAWNLQPCDVPDDVYSDDDTCCEFWMGSGDSRKYKFGVGKSIEAAILDLRHKL